jgi:hypothetical protein
MSQQIAPNTVITATKISKRGARCKKFIFFFLIPCIWIEETFEINI